MNYKFTEIEAKIFDAVKNSSYDKPITSRRIEERTGNYNNRWKVFWTPESFKDLRPIAEGN